MMLDRQLFQSKGTDWSLGRSTWQFIAVCWLLFHPAAARDLCNNSDGGRSDPQRMVKDPVKFLYSIFSWSSALTTSDGKTSPWAIWIIVACLVVIGFAVFMLSMQHYYQQALFAARQEVEQGREREQKLLQQVLHLQKVAQEAQTLSKAHLKASPNNSSDLQLSGGRGSITYSVSQRLPTYPSTRTPVREAGPRELALKAGTEPLPLLNIPSGVALQPTFTKNRSTVKGVVINYQASCDPGHIVSQLPLVTSVVIDHHDLGDAGTLALATTLRPSLTRLVIKSAGIQARGADHLAPRLPALTKLQHLNLESNMLGEEGAVAIAKTLGELHKLKTLELGSNHINAAGMVRLVPAFLHLRMVQQLGLNNNGFGVEGMRALATCLPTLRHLLDLNLTACGLGETGAEVLGSALVETHGLKVLKLASNDIGDTGVSSLAPALRVHRRSLLTIELQNNGVSVEGRQHVQPNVVQRHVIWTDSM